MNSYAAALRRAAEIVDVPGTPRSLRLDNLEVAGDRVRLWWSFIDPEVLPGDREPHRRRIRGELEVAMERGRPEEVAGSWWAEAQLAAGRRYALQIDADWEPGEPYVRRMWSTDEAWRALVSHLGGYGAEVRVDDGRIRVVRTGEETVYVIDPDEWAAYLTDPEATGPDDSEIVPVGTPLVDDLPLWVVDELDEAAGAWGPVIGLVGGRLVGLDRRDR